MKTTDWTPTQDSNQTITINPATRTLEVRRVRIVGERNHPTLACAVESSEIPATREGTMELLRDVHSRTNGGKNFSVGIQVVKGWEALGLKRS